MVGYPDARLRVAQLAVDGQPRAISTHDLELVEYVSPVGARGDTDICNPGAAHLAITVDDIHDRYRRLVTAGVAFVSPPNEITAGVNQGGFACYFRDPDDIVLELLQPPPTRLAERATAEASRTRRTCSVPRVCDRYEMKKLINDPGTVVADALKGIEAAHPGLRVDHEHKVIYRADAPVTGKVGLVSGGGSGHEPLHGGFVGVGMLDAACPGEVFTSPTPDQMLAATSLVDGGAGVLHIVKNYTGDVMNFEMAAELAAESTGAKVESIVTNDDVAVEDSLYTAGRRGVGVTVLVEKLCGAAAEAGQDLASVAAIGRKANGWGRSMGMALTSCTVPAAGQPTFELGDDEVEIGIGIHGEPGRFREPLGTAAEIAERLLEPIVADLPFVAGDPVLAFVNGMGGTPLLELYVMFGEVSADPRRPRPDDRPLARRLLHHLAGDGRLLDHPPQVGRRADPPLGRSGQDAGPELGEPHVTTARGDRPPTRGVDPGVRRAGGRAQGLPHRARLGHR